MDELVVCGIQSILHGPLIVIVHLKDQYGIRTPAFLAVLFNVQQRRAFFFGQIAEERKYDAVLFFHRIRVNFGSCRGSSSHNQSKEYSCTAPSPPNSQP